MSTTIPEVRRGKASLERSSASDTYKAIPAVNKLSVKFLNDSIASLKDATDRFQLKELQQRLMADGDYTDAERELMNWLIEEVRKGGDLQMLLCGQTTDATCSQVEDSTNDEQYEARRQTQEALLDALGSGKYDFRDLKPIIEEFRRLSTDGDGFTQDEARSIQNMLGELA